MTCSCDHDELGDVDEDDGPDHQAEIEVVVGDADGFISAAVRGGDGESSAEMVDTLRDVLGTGSEYLDKTDDPPDKGVQ